MESECGCDATWNEAERAIRSAAWWGDVVMLRSRKRLSIWPALMPHLGGKRRLAPLIFREIDQIVPRRRWSELTLLDAFLGGGSISLYAKAQGFSVLATDIAERAIVSGKAIVENSRVRLAREDVLRVLATTRSEPGRVESTMVPSVFTAEQARFIDSALRVASQMGDTSKAALIKFLALRVALLAHPYAQVRKGTIHRMTTGEFESITESAVYHYVDGLRLTTPARLWELAQQINAGVFEGRATVQKGDVMTLLPEIEADVMYADPPYSGGVMSYEKEYACIDEILEGARRPTSPFTAVDGDKMIDVLLGKALHVPIWVLSFGNVGTTLEELEAKMTRLGRRTKAVALKYQHLPAVATEEKKRENREYLVIGVDPDARLLRGASKHVVGDRLLGVELHDSVPGVESHAGAVGTERPAAEALPDDPLQECEAPLPDRLPPSLPAEAVPQPQLRIDEPDAVLTEGALDGDGEVGWDSCGHRPDGASHAAEGQAGDEVTP
jgi:adenine-specific DNA-methyltransferase